MPRYIRAQPTKSGIATPTTTASDAEARALDPRREEQEQAAVERNRRCRVARGIARVDGQAFEPLDVRALALDDQRGRAVGPGLERDREQDEGGEQPALA